MTATSVPPTAPDRTRATMGALFDIWSEPASRAIEVAPRAWSVCAGIVNVGVIETDEGLVLIDAGLRQQGEELRALVRSVTSAPLHTVVFTHGHIDHALGLGPLLEETVEQTGSRPRVLAHRNVPARFERYLRTAGLNSSVNARQSGGPATWWPTGERDFVWPDTVYDDRMTLRVGGEEIHLRHAKGETDDATWAWMPGRKLLAVGDLWLGVCPNAGNPQKVQRYAEEWADAAEEMAATGAEAMIPGHGMPVTGAAAVRERWLDAAELIRHLVDHTLAALNAGRTHEQIVRSLELPEHLAAKPYLQPYHDRPEFVVRNLIRRYGGWWDGRAANLLPAATGDQARELVTLAGGAGTLVDRAYRLADTDLALACHLAEWAALGEPDNPTAHRCLSELFERRYAAEPSFQARGIFRDAITRSQAALDRLGAAENTAT
ncbi:alkyl sulfatase dimerization domain-containing protein [Streptomyces iconiensis]|uniref:Alkyl sulfatase dimerization domain-containing protein n=1 Tax=Streptomyces iconiensis TaxID=1384038 RepID=A0ABT7A5N2_9ACTN|nr:alkyl sulfatase dimerization domain-containing protein [Streptomyces iconiensis]MDJ1136634.1 alkyl sulfatase dimerization domain-containing protein [Streptomyces iconiensis]